MNFLNYVHGITLTDNKTKVQRNYMTCLSGYQGKIRLLGPCWRNENGWWLPRSKETFLLTASDFLYNTHFQKEQQVARTDEMDLKQRGYEDCDPGVEEVSSLVKASKL